MTDGTHKKEEKTAIVCAHCNGNGYTLDQYGKGTYCMFCKGNKETGRK